MPLSPVPLTRRRSLLALAGGGLVGVRAWGQPPAPAVTRQHLLVGQVMSLQGGRNERGAAVRQGVEAALNVVNGNGGVHGRQLSIRVLDDMGQPDQARLQAQRLVDEGVFLLFGPVDDAPAAAVMDVALAQGVPLFGPMAGLARLRRPHQPLVFPVCADHRDEFSALLSQAHGLGMRRPALVLADSEAGRQHLAEAQRLAQALGMAAVLALPVPAGANEATLQNLADQLQAQRADLVFNHGTVDRYERLIRHARAASSGRAFWGISTDASTLVQRLGPLAHGMRFTQVVPSPWDGKTALTREYQAAFRASFRDQAFSHASLEGYLTTRALAEALYRAGPQPSRASFLAGLADATLDIAGYILRYPRGEHLGGRFVDTALVNRDGGFIQ